MEFKHFINIDYNNFSLPLATLISIFITPSVPILTDSCIEKWQEMVIKAAPIIIIRDEKGNKIDRLPHIVRNLAFEYKCHICTIDSESKYIKKDDVYYVYRENDRIVELNAGVCFNNKVTFLGTLQYTGIFIEKKDESIFNTIETLCTIGYTILKDYYMEKKNKDMVSMVGELPENAQNIILQKLGLLGDDSDEKIYSIPTPKSRCVSISRHSTCESSPIITELDEDAELKLAIELSLKDAEKKEESILKNQKATVEKQADQVLSGTPTVDNDIVISIKKQAKEA